MASISLKCDHCDREARYFFENKVLEVGTERIYFTKACERHLTPVTKKSVHVSRIPLEKYLIQSVMDG